MIIDQKKEPQKVEIVERLTRLGWTYSMTHSKLNPGMIRFNISREPWFKNLLFSHFGQHSYGKTLTPSDCVQMTSSEREALFLGYMRADGCYPTNNSSGTHFDSVSPNLIDGMQFLANLLGKSCRKVSYKCMEAGMMLFPNGREYWSRKSYRCYVHRCKPVTHIARTDFKVGMAQDVMVHCVTTRTGMFLARTNGKVFVAGNCDLGRYLCAQLERGDRPPEESVLQRSLKIIANLDAGRASDDESKFNFNTVGAGDLERNSLV